MSKFMLEADVSLSVDRVFYLEFNKIDLVEVGPSPVILSDAPKVPKQAEAKRDGVINPQNYNFIQF